MPEQKTDICENVRCGANADCVEQGKIYTCVCKAGFSGNPWLACRPECTLNTDCELTKACMNSKCINPCTGACGVDALCDIVNHVPVCYCPPDFSGDPFVSCFPFRQVVEATNPCDPSPCGPFSRCLVSPQGYATCSCLPNYRGAPPMCKPECIVSAECLPTHACVNQRCIDPCPGTCGQNALCSIINHNPICSCPPSQQGDPFTKCYIPITQVEQPKNPCSPSPCGPNSICQVKQNRPVCSCQANYIGSPPYCSPECVISQQCNRNQACIKEKCVDPCPGSCGQNARCSVVSHTPFCVCEDGYEGDAFVGCSKIVRPPEDPCNPPPCGVNAKCSVVNGLPRCTCIPPYIGNPYGGGCKPECTINSDCESHLACLAQHCRDPCQGLCGNNAYCGVVNHVPSCSCRSGFEGDPFTACKEQPKTGKFSQPP